MSEQIIKAIELEINHLIQQKSTYTNIAVILIGSTISLVLTSITIFKSILILAGFWLSIAFLANIENCNQ